MEKATRVAAARQGLSSHPAHAPPSSRGRRKKQFLGDGAALIGTAHARGAAADIIKQRTIPSLSVSSRNDGFTGIALPTWLSLPLVCVNTPAD